MKFGNLGVSIKSPHPASTVEKQQSATTATPATVQEDYIFNEKDLRFYWFEYANLLPVEEAANAGRMKAMTPHLLNDTARRRSLRPGIRG